MNHTKLLLLALFVVAVVGDLSLTSTALVRERQFYESTLDHATQVSTLHCKLIIKFHNILTKNLIGYSTTTKQGT